MSSNYTDLFKQLNDKDEEYILDKKKKNVEAFYKQSKLPGNVAELNPEMIKDIDSFNSFITKPATPDACIVLRKTMLYHIEKASPDQAKTLVEYVKYFECL
jgi:hypothetical protein